MSFLSKLSNGINCDLRFLPIVGGDRSKIASFAHNCLVKNKRRLSHPTLQWRCTRRGHSTLQWQCHRLLEQRLVVRVRFSTKTLGWIPLCRGDHIAGWVPPCSGDHGWVPPCRGDQIVGWIPPCCGDHMGGRWWSRPCSREHTIEVGGRSELRR
jgi:hypothetical protein